MIITEEWLESIKDDQGLTKGQEKILDIWQKRQAFVGHGMLPDQVATFIEGCRGYRKMPIDLMDRMK